MTAVPAPPPVPTVPEFPHYEDKDYHPPKDIRYPLFNQKHRRYVESLLRGLCGACVQTFRGKEAAPPRILGMVVVVFAM